MYLCGSSSSQTSHSPHHDPNVARDVSAEANPRSRADPILRDLRNSAIPAGDSISSEIGPTDVLVLLPTDRGQPDTELAKQWNTLKGFGEFVFRRTHEIRKSLSRFRRKKNISTIGSRNLESDAIQTAQRSDGASSPQTQTNPSLGGVHDSYYSASVAKLSASNDNDKIVGTRALAGSQGKPHSLANDPATGDVYKGIRLFTNVRGQDYEQARNSPLAIQNTKQTK
jgi:hypothetical protein